MLALVRVRGIRGVSPRITRTLEFLRLTKPNHCVVLEDTPQNKGMLNMAKDYITYGPVDEEMIFALLMKRGTRGAKALKEVASEDEVRSAVKEIMGGKRVRDFADPVFRLRPPRKGYKDIKIAWPRGDLGARDDIKPLLRRMM